MPLRERVYEALRRAPATQTDLAASLGCSLGALRLRVQELHDERKVRIVGTRPSDSGTGRPHWVWGLA
jgi:predicted ArsR family transcriptional regulator